MIRNRIELHKKISEIINRLQIQEKAGIVRVCISPTPSHIDYVRQKLQAKDMQIPFIQENRRSSSSLQEAIEPEQSMFAAIIRVLKQIIRKIFSFRARKKERRLRSMRKHLIINSQG